MALCGGHGVTLSFYDDYGRFLARLEGRISGNVLLRREQYRTADNLERRAFIASAIVLAKIANGRNVLLRAVRDYPDDAENDKLKSAIGRMAICMKKLKNNLPVDSVRGVEGEAARVYFSVFNNLIKAQNNVFYMSERSRRPPMDNLNALLSFLYTLLANDVSAALSGVGLDYAVGFLHVDRAGRPGLTLDLMEEMRPAIADRLALNLINRQQLQGKDFIKSESGAVLMTDVARKEVIIAYQKRKQEEINHPFINEKISYGLIPHVQAMLMARFLRGDIDGYPPFKWK
jgi:CRISPR-associated protein Cas1